VVEWVGGVMYLQSAGCLARSQYRDVGEQALPFIACHHLPKLQTPTAGAL
jgi:hypothetical protein